MTSVEARAAVSRPTRSCLTEVAVGFSYSLTELHYVLSHVYLIQPYPKVFFFVFFFFNSAFSSHASSQLPADENPLKMGKTTTANPRRAALGEITNVNAAAANAKVINHQSRLCCNAVPLRGLSC